MAPYYGIYLIPPPHLLYPLALGHHVLASDYHVRAAGRFMVHCTVKGFFKLADGATLDDFLPKLDALFARTPAFPTGVTELYVDCRDEGVYGVSLLLRRTEVFHRLHEEVCDVVRPYIAPDCAFSPTEPTGPDFPPHLTLAMADLPTDPGLVAQVISLCAHIHATVPQGEFQGCDMQLIEFASDDWSGRWWETLRYTQRKGWQLTTPHP